MAKTADTQSVRVLLQGKPQAQHLPDPYYERFGLIIPCGEAKEFEVDPETLAALHALGYITVTPVAEPVADAHATQAPVADPPVADPPAGA